MTEQKQAAVLTVTSVDAARMLLDAKSRAALRVFLSAPSTVHTAALAAEVLPNTMLAMVRRFVRHGILVERETVVQKGRRLRSYQSAAQEFLIPLPLIEDLMLLPEKYWQGVFNGSFSEAVLNHHYTKEPIGVRVHQLSNGTVVIGAVIGTDNRSFPTRVEGSAVFFDWSPLRLAPAEAEELQAELNQLSDRYAKKSSNGTETYLLGLHLTPMRESNLHQAPRNSPSESS